MKNIEIFTYFVLSQLVVKSQLEHDFFNLKLDMCALYSCRDRCNIAPEPGIGFTCFCDADCVHFGDCCHDYFSHCNMLSEEAGILNYLKYRVESASQDYHAQKVKEFIDLSTCHPFHTDSYLDTYILSIRRCPSGYIEGDIKEKCNGGQRAFPLDIPVSIPSMMYWTFSNVYCAWCHNITIEEMSFWQANISCQIRNGEIVKTVDELANYEPNEACKTIVSKPDNRMKIRSCAFKLEPLCTEREINSGTTTVIPITHITETGTSKQELSESTSNITTNSNTLDAALTDSTSAAPPYGPKVVNSTQHDSPLEHKLVNSSVNVTPYTRITLPASITIPLEIMETTFEIDTLTQENLSLLCKSYYFPVGYDSKHYANPHCRACSNGWVEFQNSETILCEIFMNFEGIRIIGDSSRVDHIVGVYGKQVAFFSYETKTILENNRSNCNMNSYYNFVSDQCEQYLCPFDSYPYYESCIHNTLPFNATPLAFTLSKLHVLINASYLAFDMKDVTFTKLTQKIHSLIQDSKLDMFNLSSDMRSSVFPRNVEITSLKLIKEGTISNINSAGKTIVMAKPQQFQIGLEVPILLNVLSRTISELLNLLSGSYDIWIDEIQIESHFDQGPPSCSTTLQKTYNDVPVVIIGPHLFVQIDGDLIDISATHFVIRQNETGPTKLDLITLCPPDIMSKARSVQCQNITLTSTMFHRIDDGIELSNGQVIKLGNFIITDETAVICRSAILKDNLASSDTRSKIWFKNITSTVSLIVKLMSFIVNLLARRLDIYFHVLALVSSAIDLTHLLENMKVATARTTIPVVLHFCWLFLNYSLLAWCVNKFWYREQKITKCLCNHFSISLLVPVLMIVVCATGDINDPPWDIGYGQTDKIFSVNKNIVLMGFIVPCAVGLAGMIICHLYRLIRHSSYDTEQPLYRSHILITSLSMLQFGFGCCESLTNQGVFYYLYFICSLIIGWTFLIISVQRFSRRPDDLSKSHH